MKKKGQLHFLSRRLKVLSVDSSESLSSKLFYLENVLFQAFSFFLSFLLSLFPMSTFLPPPPPLQLKHKNRGLRRELAGRGTDSTDQICL